MVIECMCVVCHGPIQPLPHRKVTAIACRDNGGLCKSVWRRSARDGHPIPWKYEDLRFLHQLRREQQALLLRLEQRFPQLAAIARSA